MKKSVTIVLFLLTAFFAGQRARAASAAGGEGPFFPGSRIALRDGDILLTYAPSLLNSCNRTFAKPEGKYAHALVYVELPDEGGRLVDFSANGLRKSEVKNHLEKLREVALVRPRVPPDKGRLAAAFLEMKRLYDEKKIKFDFALRWTDAQDGRYYCAEFISHLFRESGLPDPFPLNSFPADDFWVNWYAEHLEIDYARIVSPNAPLHLPDFQLLSEYRSNDPAEERNEIILDTIFLRIGEYLHDDKADIRAPSLGSRLLVNIAGLGLTGGALVRGLPRKGRTVFVVLREYVLLVMNKVNRIISSQSDREWTREDIAALTRRAADAFRGRYFVNRE